MCRTSWAVSPYLSQCVVHHGLSPDTYHSVSYFMGCLPIPITVCRTSWAVSRYLSQCVVLHGLSPHTYHSVSYFMGCLPIPITVCRTSWAVSPYLSQCVVHHGSLLHGLSQHYDLSSALGHHLVESHLPTRRCAIAKSLNRDALNQVTNPMLSCQTMAKLIHSMYIAPVHSVVRMTIMLHIVVDMCVYCVQIVSGSAWLNNSISRDGVRLNSLPGSVTRFASRGLDIAVSKNLPFTCVWCIVCFVSSP